MKLEGLSDKIRALGDLSFILKNKQKLQLIAMNELEASIKLRVFLDGKASDGSDIGHYSTKPLYVNVDKLPTTLPVKGKIAKAKTNQDKTKAKEAKAFGVQTKDRKTLYVEGGYKQLKSLLNFDSGTVNLTLTGASKESVKVGKKGDNIVFGYSDKDKKEILQGNEKKFGKKIFTPNNEEIEEVNKVVHNSVVQLFKDQVKTW